MSTAPTLRLPSEARDLAVALADPAVRANLAAQLPDWLRARRWFGGQTRQLRAVEFAGWLALPDGAALAMIVATDTEGATTRHPLLLSATANGALADGLERSALRAYLLTQLLGGGTLEGEGLRILGVPLVAGEAIDAEQSRVVGVEQSNTSIIYGDRAIMKLYRRLVAGPNPEVELGRYLTTASFGAVPRLLATAQLAGPDGFLADLLVLQDFVPNDGDGWAWAVAAAKRALEANDTPDALADWLAQEGTTLELAASLGATTAELHATLAAATDEDLRPQPLTPADLAAQAITLQHEAGETLATLDRAGHADPALRAAVAAVGQIALSAVVDGGLRTRVHGDYHLGQVLRGERGWIILDFEGEPARTLAERRQRQSPLADVAGMARSWSYAAYTGHAGAPAAAGRGVRSAELAEHWETLVRQAFLDAYWAAAQNARVPFLPTSDADHDTLLRAFEVQKALYEVRYEVNNRPDWLHIPAGAIERMANAGTHRSG